jgi:hypothetical protein
MVSKIIYVIPEHNYPFLMSLSRSTRTVCNVTQIVTHDDACTYYRSRWPRANRSRIHSEMLLQIALGSEAYRTSPTYGSAISPWARDHFTDTKTDHRQDDNPRQIQRSHYSHCQRGFSRTGATCYTNNAGISPWRLVVGSSAG